SVIGERISCSERMPEKYDFDIWVFSPSRGVLDGLQWDGSMFTDDEYQFVIHDATHWMRKVYPAAPQQDGE
ncbi:valyl-tRNA synthetase, partial [Escherichia coli]